MNERGRDLLIQAALSGHPQTTQVYHTSIQDPFVGDCALGVLHLSLHVTRAEANDCRDTYSHVKGEFDIRDNAKCECPECGREYWDEHNYIAHLNDDHCLDFLTIARKV